MQTIVSGTVGNTSRLSAMSTEPWPALNHCLCDPDTSSRVMK